MEDLTDILEGNMRKAAIVVNLQDGLSSIFAIVIHLSVSYAGQFTVIISSTACYVLGLMIFWLSAWTSKHVSVFCGAVVLIALGEAGKSLPPSFLRYQMKVKLKCTQDDEQSRDEKKETKEINPEQHMREQKRETRDINPEEQQIGVEKRESGDRNQEERQIGDYNIEEVNPEEREIEEDKKESRKIHTDKQTGDEKRESADQDREKRLKEQLKYSFGFFQVAAFGSAILVNSLLPKETRYPKNYKIGALLMVAAYLLFYSGSFSYRFGTPSKSPLQQIYRVFKVALRKLDLKYPTSLEKYYWNDGDVDNKANFCYERGRTDFCCIKTTRSVEFRLKPRVPSLWRWLDKAAIIRENNPDFSVQMPMKKGQLCTVKEVSEVKHFSSLIHLSLIFLPYSLVMAAAKTFFVEQSKHMKSDFASFWLMVIKNVTAQAVVFLFDVECRVNRYKREHRSGKLYRSKEKIFLGVHIIKKRFQGMNATVVRIGAGIVCAVLCCIAARQVESHRLSLSKKEGDKISMSIAVLIPQFVLLGLMQGLAERGLKIYYEARTPKCMHIFLGPFGNVMLGIGKLLTIPCIFIFHGWFKVSINNSHLDMYFLVLGLLNCLSLGIYVYYSIRYACKDIPQDMGSEESGSDDWND